MLDSLTLADIARKFQADENTILRWALEGKLPAPILVADERVRWAADDLSRWWADGCPAGAALSHRQALAVRSAIADECLARCDALIDKIGEQRAAEIFDNLELEN
ncbi:MAG: hypothetical protein KJ000_29215 [Pirellulaceae bacterium]|nr:hypothetical protein [Pirellulaceae bacterium]